MSSRMDKYKENQVIPTRSDKNKELYKQVYNAYDEFENLIVPSNAKEIKFRDLKKELITSREEYHDQKVYDDIAAQPTNNTVIRKEMLEEESKQQNEIYDINELLDKAVVDKEPEEKQEPKLANEDYLKRLKLDNRKTNLEQVKEMYDEIREEALEENESLIHTANLSLEILSDLKSDNEATQIRPAIKEEEEPEEDDTFYSSDYKFSKRDFEGNEFGKKEKVKIVSSESTEDDEEDDEDDEDDDDGNFFIKVLLLVVGVIVIGLIMFILIRYFN